LIRYDGKTWTPLHALDHKTDRRLDGAIAGAGPRAAVLVHARTAAALVIGDTVTTGGDVRALVTANRATVAAEFPLATRGNYAAASNGLSNLFADAAGNLWLLDAQRLSVLAGDRWLDTGTPLRAAGSPAGFVHFASAVGDGSKVYVTDFATLNRGVAALGEVHNDHGPTVVFTPAQRTGERELTYLTLRDPAGALWLPITYRPGDPGRPSGHWATRLTEKGVDAQFDTSGLPMLVDRGGTVGLGQPRRPADHIPARLHLWRDGRVVHSLDITGAGDRFRLFADRPGSVWAWTDLGLQHFVAKDPADPRTYTLARTYTPQGVDRRIELVEFSPLGFVALTAATIAPEAPRTLYLVRLPAD
jgi:hypothetical protein